MWRACGTPFTRWCAGAAYGRGAMDTKGALAAFMAACADAGRLGLRGDVILTAVVDEEYASAGTEAVVKRVEGRRGDCRRADRPGDRDRAQGLCVVRDRDTRRGGPRVAARPGRGRHLQDGEGPGGDRGGGDAADEVPAASTLGPGSMHASLIQGGQELSSYPALCRSGIERRTLPGEDLDVNRGRPSGKYWRG